MPIIGKFSKQCQRVEHITFTVNNNHTDLRLCIRQSHTAAASVNNVRGGKLQFSDRGDCNGVDMLNYILHCLAL